MQTSIQTVNTCVNHIVTATNNNIYTHFFSHMTAERVFVRAKSFTVQRYLFKLEILLNVCRCKIPVSVISITFEVFKRAQI